MLFQERQNNGDSKKISGFQGWGKEVNRWSTVQFRPVKILCDTLMVNICHYLSKFMEYTTSSINLNVNTDFA